MTCGVLYQVIYRVSQFSLRITTNRERCTYRVIYRVSPYVLRIKANRWGKMHISWMLYRAIYRCRVWFKKYTKSVVKWRHVECCIMLYTRRMKSLGTRGIMLNSWVSTFAPPCIEWPLFPSVEHFCMFDYTLKVFIVQVVRRLVLI